jgi:TBC1 domain family member 5
VAFCFHSALNLSGMHEVLAPLYYAIHYDTVSENDTAHSDLQSLCSPLWVAADAWTLFDRVMAGISRWYEWREPTSLERSVASPPFANHVHLNVTEGPIVSKPYVTPVVQTCNLIQSTILRTVDPELWKRMQSTGIEPQIYGM